MTLFGSTSRLLLLAVVLSMTAAAQDALPRVLIIGDSVYRQPAAEAAKELKGKAQIEIAAFEPHEVCNTSTALEKLNRILGEGRWDLIHFNFGLGDLAYRAPGIQSYRLLPKHAGGVRTTSAEQYESDLDKLVTRLKSTNAKLVWASTTPIRHSSTGVFEKGSEIEYNAIAAGVMRKHGVPTNDMYGFVLELIDMEKPAGHGADPFHFDKKPIHPPIVASIRRELNL
jgi:hypothetical protein